jgi:hypothetical protein
MTFRLINSGSIREVDLPMWEKFQFWVESGAIQLRIELITYYMLCALWGALTSLGYFCLR